MVASLNNNKLEADITTVTVTQIEDLLHIRSKRERAQYNKSQGKSPIIDGGMAIGVEVMLSLPGW